MAIKNIGNRHPPLQITGEIERRISNDRPPEEHIEVWRDPIDLDRGQALPVIARFPLARAPVKKSPNVS